MKRDAGWVKSLWVRYFRSEMTRDQCKDAGMAMVLIFLLLALFLKDEIYLVCALGLHVTNMIVPPVFRPVAVLWLGMAHLLGTLMSWMILSVVFLVVVTPVGLLRSVMGADSLKLKEFKAGRESVMQERNRTFTAEDIRKPY